MPRGTAMNLHVPLPPDLANPESQTRALLDAMAEGVSLARRDGTIVYANPAEERMFGVGPGEMLGTHVLDHSALPPGEAEARAEESLAALEATGEWEGEGPCRRRDGTTFPSRMRVRRVEMGGETFGLCLRSDISGEAQLAQEWSRLHLATEAAGIGAFDLDPRTGRVTLSPRAKEIAGFPRDAEVTRQEFRARVHPEDRERAFAQAARALDPGERAKVAIDYRLIRPDEKVRHVRATGEVAFEHGPEGPRAVRYLGALQDVTDRRAGEEAEREAAQRLSMALSAGRMAAWETDLIADRIGGSPELNALLGFPAGVPLDTDAVRARYAPGEGERLRAVAQEALGRGETSWEVAFHYLRAPDDPRWLRLRCEMRFDAEGRPAKVLGVVFDDTERRRAEEELRASEARLRLANRVLGAGVWDRDLAQGTVVWSPEEFALHGLDPGLSMSGQPAAWWEAVHPEDREVTAARITALEVGGGELVHEYRILRDGAVRWIRLHASTLAGPDGRPARMMGVETDVTVERLEAEALRARADALEGEVAEGRRQIGRLHALSPDLFAVAGFDGRLRTVNPAWTRLLGWSEAELLARDYLSLVHPEDVAAAAAAVERMLAGEPVRSFQNRLLARDGGHHWIDWAAVPEGVVFYAVGRDVTRDRAREEALRQAQKMDALGQLTGGIAHDFNNLLQAVQGSLALIARRPGDADRVRMLAEEGVRAAERGGRLTAQLLAFSRSRQVELRPVELGALVGGMAELLRRSLGPLVELRLELPEGEVAAQADATQVEMAVLNLAINARDALGGAGAVTVRLGARRIEGDPDLAPGDYAEIAVEDEGEGMAPEVATRAFEPFFTTKGVGKGTGLGLSQVYGMARQAGGTARIASTPGRGTTVRVLLPRVARPAAAPPGSRAETGRANRPMRVLVVDDDPDVRRWLVAALQALGHAAVEAADGPTGLARLDDGVDLAILDVAMPGMSGVEVAAAIRARRPELPVILATGFADLAQLPEGLRVLRKPFALAELEAALTGASR